MLQVHNAVANRSGCTYSNNTCKNPVEPNKKQCAYHLNADKLKKRMRRVPDGPDQRKLRDDISKELDALLTRLTKIVNVQPGDVCP